MILGLFLCVMAFAATPTPANAGPANRKFDFALIPPPEPSVKPQILHPEKSDADSNKIDDRIDSRIKQIKSAVAAEHDPGRRAALEASLDEMIRVELVFSQRISQKQIDDFIARGGQIDYIYRHLSYGWNAKIPQRLAEILPQIMGDSLVVVAADSVVRLCVDEATRTGRVRPIWVPGFAGSVLGFSGNSNTTIAILDTGGDDSHPDLNGRNEYWDDYTSDNMSSPCDFGGHGTHVTAIAVGSGAAAGAVTSTLLYTDGGDLSGVINNNFSPSPIKLPAGQSTTFSSVATWVGGGTTNLSGVWQANGSSTASYYGITSPANGASPLTKTNTFTASGNNHYSAALQQSGSSVGLYSIVSTVTYSGVGDGFNTFSGVAPGCQWAGGKVFRNDGTSSSTDIGAAIDNMVSNREGHKIKVLNMSLHVEGADVPLRNKVNNMVSNGIIAVIAAGNKGPGTGSAYDVDDPGRAGKAITVGASNDVNQLTNYSSCGFTSPGSNEDNKPDILAPGGSYYYSRILAADSNDSDAATFGYTDKRPNDYANLSGTSMSSPFVAGASALVIQALEQSGVTWNFNSSLHPLLVKMLLCATATETNADREASSGTNPTLGRATTPKDLYEGYGMINPDAAIEAVILPYSSGVISGSTAGGSYDRRAWARKLSVTSGAPVTLNLDAPPTADLDLYVYSGTPDTNGNPVIRASSALAGNGVDEAIYYTPSSTETAYLVVKRVSGNGAWSLSGSTIPDTTPPTAPVITDDGAYMTSGSQLHASWTATDAQSPITEYMYAISSTKLESGIISGGGWLSVGSLTQHTRTGLTLANGQAYYVLAKAKNSVNLWSAVGVSDGITRVANAGISISAAKALANLSTVGTPAKVVTAIFSDHFYIEEPDKYCGIRVSPIEMPVWLDVGDTVDVGGTMQTVNQERQIGLATVTEISTYEVRPLGLNNPTIGGGDWQYNSGTGAGQKGIPGAMGLNNIGLLVTTWGEVTQTGTNYLYIDDGAHLIDGAITEGSQKTGVYIDCDPDGYFPGDYLLVKGISSCFIFNGNPQRRIVTRDTSDVIKLQ
ncbi:MAG: S8 family serine peptidase [Armatimonadota bacterium]|nr:S8 family serine peptidase [Armatimonadota bacterium]